VPSEPQEDGAEPDYRFTLANERTFLAWIRTALALLAGGIALEEVAGSFASESTRTALAIMAVALSLVLAVSSFVRWRQVQSAMRQDTPLPHPWAVPVLATGVVTVSGIVALVLVFQ
jgi:putative membrane protein